MTTLLRRLAGHLARGLVMIWVVTTFTFFLVQAMPGDPVSAQYELLLQQGMSPDQAEAQTAVTYGFVPTGSVWSQYTHYLWQLLHLDLGVSVKAQGVKVSDQVLSAMPWTVVLVFSGILISFLVGVTLGVVAALRRSSATGHALSLSGSLLHSVPPFAIGLILISLLASASGMQIFPSGGSVDAEYVPGFNGWYISNVAWHAILPALAYALSTYGGWLLAMKSSVVSVLGDDFLLAAELRGLSPFTRFRYLARNAILPLFTVLALSFGLMFGGSVFIERIFNYQGLGVLLFNSIGARDYSLMNGAFLLITIAVILANILADLLYTVIDPRVRRA